MKILEQIKNKVIISVQAMPDEPLYKEECMTALMQTVIDGGAQALRLAGVRDIKIAKKLFNVPVIGITKPDKLPDNWLDTVYITPTLNDARAIIDSGADIIALDATKRQRPKETLEEILDFIHKNNKLAMADISTFEEGIYADKIGFDLISTTLSGYTSHSRQDLKTPDFELLEKLVKNVKTPVILEGRIWERSEVTKAFQLGAHAVVIGSAVTRPKLITKRFIERN